MEYLLDTHTFLWFINGDDQLSQKAKDVIANPDTIKHSSIISFWEIAIKVNLGKLKLDIPFDDLRKHVTLNGFELLPLTFEHTIKLTNLELHHRDPFDRIIICQTLVESLTLISKDSNLGKYGRIQLLW